MQCTILLKIVKKYLSIISNYSKDEANIFSELFGKLVMMYETNDEITDILGEIFMREKLGSNNLGQFFTPFNVSELMADIIIGEKNLEEIINNKGYITLCEPCCGAGGMVLATAKVLKNKNINYQEKLLVHAIDISEICVYMTYIQLSLYGIPAIVCCGDSLSKKIEFCLETPLYFLNYWKFRKSNSNEQLDDKDNEEIKEMQQLKKSNIEFNEVIKNGMCQISLF